MKLIISIVLLLGFSELKIMSQDVIFTSGNTAYLFDIDGVLVSPTTKSVEHAELFDEMIRRLSQGHFIGLNTGRSLEFMVEHILSPLEERIVDRRLLQHVFACGEKGGVFIEYDVQGERVIQIASDIQVPPLLCAEIKEKISRAPFSDIVFYDETKRTMISIELKKGRDVEDFRQRQPHLKMVLQDFLEGHTLAKQCYLDATTICFDIQSTHAGKDTGARKFVEWLQKKGHHPQRFITFGDSASDHAMCVELLRLGQNPTFVYVGGQEVGASDKCCHITFWEQFDRGTLSFLKTEQ